MPVIITEIEIALEVAPSNASQSNQSSATDASRRNEIISECVEKVMEIMNLKNER